MFAPWRSQSSLPIHGYPITGRSFIGVAELKLFQGKKVKMRISFKEYLLQCSSTNLRNLPVLVCDLTVAFYYSLLFNKIVRKQWITEKVPFWYVGLEFPSRLPLVFVLLMVLEEQWRMWKYLLWENIDCVRVQRKCAIQTAVLKH